MEILLKREDRSERSERHDRHDDVSKKISAWVIALMVALLILEVLAMVWAAYLSWTSNSVFSHSPVAKVVYAIFAFLWGIGYVVNYIINRADLVRLAKSQTLPVAAAAAAAAVTSAYA